MLGVRWATSTLSTSAHGLYVQNTYTHTQKPHELPSTERTKAERKSTCVLSIVIEEQTYNTIENTNSFHIHG